MQAKDISSNSNFNSQSEDSFAEDGVVDLEEERDEVTNGALSSGVFQYNQSDVGPPKLIKGLSDPFAIADNPPQHQTDFLGAPQQDGQAAELEPPSDYDLTHSRVSKKLENNGYVPDTAAPTQKKAKKGLNNLVSKVADPFSGMGQTKKPSLQIEVDQAKVQKKDMMGNMLDEWLENEEPKDSSIQEYQDSGDSLQE